MTLSVRIETGRQLSRQYTTNITPGEAIIFSGYVFNDSTVPGVGYYILDGQGPAQSFVIPATGSEPLSNYPYINITGLNPGPHHLEVRNAGDETTAALGILSIIVKDTSSPSSEPSKNSRTSGKIIGGVVGGGLCAALLLVILAILLWRRRKRRQEPPRLTIHEGLPVQDRQVAGGTTVISTGEMSQRPASLQVSSPIPPSPGPRTPTASPIGHNRVSTPNVTRLSFHPPGGDALGVNSGSPRDPPPS